MALLRSSVLTPKGLAVYTSEAHSRRRNAAISPSATRRSLIVLTMNTSGMKNAFPIKVSQIPAVGPGPAKSSGGNLPMPNIPPWAKWVVGAIIVAIPIYRKIRTLENRVEKTAEVAIEVVDTVAEATEKVAGEITEAFPGNEGLKEAASKIKTITDAIEEDAEKAEALIHKPALAETWVFDRWDRGKWWLEDKYRLLQELARSQPNEVDEIKQEVDAIVDPIIDKVMEAEEAGESTQGKEVK
ncbi:hypothetical protein ACP4OV_024296 [Aristida adscensionis]